MSPRLNQRFKLRLSLPPLKRPTPAPETEAAAWWHDAVFYEIFVRSFNDSNGDGIGDFNGIAQKLDYLQELGVNALWLMPIHPSPSYHGYDVLNYYAVNPQYGTMDEFKNLLNEAHARNIKIIIDLRSQSHLQPTSILHGCEQQTQIQNIVIGMFGQTNAGDHWHQGNGGYYYGYFWGGMPDLNYRNPDVTDQMI